MTNQDERFWSEFPEDELKDPASRHVLAALSDVYRIDGDDQQSVQRAWQRITSSMDQEQQQQRVASNMHQEQQQRRISRLNTLHEFPASFSFIGAKKPGHVQRSSARRRIDILVALGIIFLLVGSMIGVFAYRQSTSSSQPGKPTPALTQQPNTPIVSKRLGTSLGIFSLGLSLENLQSSSICQLPGYPIGNLWNYRCEKGTLFVSFNGPHTQLGAEAVQLDARPGFPGSTAEGLRIYMSHGYFNSLYQQFHPQEVKINSILPQRSLPFAPDILLTASNPVAFVKDANGTTLWVVFDLNQRIVQIVLQSNAVK
jgi:hypothetical protein